MGRDYRRGFGMGLYCAGSCRKPAVLKCRGSRIRWAGIVQKAAMLVKSLATGETI